MTDASVQPTIKVLLVEDDTRLAQLTARYLESHGVVVTIAQDGLEGQAEALRRQYDCLVLDLMLPGRDGLEVTRELRARTDVPIVMVTARGEEADRVLGLEVGADDYVTKPFSPRELKARIKAVLRRRAPEAAQEPLSVGPIRLDPATHRVTVDDRPVPLGAAEFRLLRYLLARPERVHTRSQLLDGVWGERAEIEERTVDVHVRRLRLALEPFGAQHLIETVRGSGYRVAAPR